MSSTISEKSAAPLPQKQEQKPTSTPDDIITLSEAKIWDSNAIAEKYGYTVHDAARLFHMLDGNAIKALAADIKQNGQRV